jgi:hypothetical protein
MTSISDNDTNSFQVRGIAQVSAFTFATALFISIFWLSFIDPMIGEISFGISERVLRSLSAGLLHISPFCVAGVTLFCLLSRTKFIFQYGATALIIFLLLRVITP